MSATLFLKRQQILRAFYFLILLTANATFAQAPVVTSFSPTVITQRTSVTINGSNFTGATAVHFGSASVSFIIVSDTKITATTGTGATGAVTVTNAAGTGTGASITYVAASPTSATAAVTRVITDYKGYWSSSAVSAVVASQPDTRHNVAAFAYNNTIYSTGVADPMLNSNSITYNTGDFRALPINPIVGNTAATTSSNYIALGSKIDGDAVNAVYTSPAVSGLNTRDVLIDGIKGLDLGTGVTNISSSMVLEFSVSNVVSSTIADSQPDILVTQIASPTTVVDIYAFTDSNGNVVGTPLQANLNSITAIGTYRLDLFTLPVNTPYNTATPNGSNSANGTRDIRMIAFKLSDFGITEANAGSIVKFKIMPGGDSDPAFIAYNAAAFLVPAPVITQHPVSQVVCPNTSGTATFTVTATGIGLNYQWRKNGVDISGATSAQYSIVNVQTSHLGTYSVVVSNVSGSVISSTAYLNAIIGLQPSPATTCINTATNLNASASGNNVTYQWYSNATSSNSGGMLIVGATAASYSPAVNIAGVRYYYATVYADGFTCTGMTTNAASVTVQATSVGGTATGTQAICAGNTAVLGLTGRTGSIQWQQSSNGTDWTNVIDGTGATTTTYTTSILSATTHYRAEVTSGTCAPAYSTTATVTVTPVSNAGTVSAGQIVCSGSSTTVTASGYVGTIQWQESDNGTTGWINVIGGSGAQSASYTTAVLSAPRWYRTAIKNGSCPELYSAATAVSFQTSTWNGTEWSNGIPTGNIAAVFTGNFTATQDFTACSLTVSNNAIVSVPGGFDVTLYGALTVSSGSFTLESTANLIQLTTAANSGNITIKRTTLPLKRLDYVLWSSPVIGQNLFDFSPQTTSTRFYTYNPSTDFYNAIALPAQTTFVSGNGYLIRMPNNHPATPLAWNGAFTGVPFNNAVSIPVTNGTYNAIGNPYPSAIDANAFIVANNLTAPLYFWRKTNNTLTTSYATYTLAGGTSTEGNTGGDPYAQVPDGTIMTGQGFIARATSAAIIFNNSMRSGNNNGRFFRTAEMERHRLWLNVTNADGVFSQTMVSYMTGATAAFDPQIDGRYINDSQIALTSLIDGNEYAIQGRTLPFDAADVVPLGFKTTAAGNYTISIDHADGQFSDETIPVFVKDQVSGIVHNLRLSDYQFATEAGVFNSRFELVYNLTLGTANHTFDSSNVLVYKEKQDIVVDTGKIIMATVKVFDIQGRLIAERTNCHSSEIKINAGPVNQVLVVQVTTENDEVVVKKIVN